MWLLCVSRLISVWGVLGKVVSCGCFCVLISSVVGRFSYLLVILKVVMFNCLVFVGGGGGENVELFVLVCVIWCGFSGCSNMVVMFLLEVEWFWWYL